MAQAYAAAPRYIGSAREIFDQLARANLPVPLREPVHGALTVLLEDDDETVAPNLASFSAFISFFDRNREIAAPSIGVNRAGLFVAVWQDPTFRLSLEFQPSGNVLWASTDRQISGTASVRNGSATLERAPLPPRRREAAFA
jgi:hypothetical protein